MISKEKDKEFWMNKEWRITTYVIISTLIFYSLFVTIAMITDLPILIGVPCELIPLFAIISAIIYFVIFRVVLLRKYRGRTERPAESP